MLAAIAERVVTFALPEPGSDFYCYRLTVPWALLSFKCAPLQSSLPHLVCVIATGGALQASLAPWVPCCSSGFLGCSFPQHSCVASVNSWDLAMFSLLSCVLSSCLLLICLQFYLHCCPEYQLCPMSRCRSRCCLLPDGWSSAQSLSYSGFTLSYFYCWEPLVYPSVVMPVAADSLSASLPWGLDFPTHRSLAELVFSPWEGCCKSTAFPSRHLFLSVQFLLLALYCHSCLSLVL